MNTIGVIHGGISHEREKSLEYGKQISKILTELGMKVLEMHLQPNGSWTVDGQVENIEQALKKTDKVWNCLVGVDGERGIVESLCEKCKVKMVGHNVLHSTLSSDKKNLQLALDQHKIRSPFGKTILQKDFNQEKVLEIFTTVPMPAIVKPLSGSGLWGISLVSNFAELDAAVKFLINQNQDVLVEKFISGTPVSCFVFEHNNLLHTHIKVLDDSTKLSRENLMQIRNEALYIHSCLAFPHHVEYDFIVSDKLDKTGEKNNLYFLEANTHPSLTHSYIKYVFKNGIISLKEYVSSKIA